jgi:hypothetical protein
LYHGSSAQSTPSSAFTEAPSSTSLILQPRGLQGNPQMEIPSMLPRLSSPFAHFSLPALLFFVAYYLQYYMGRTHAFSCSEEQTWQCL